MLPADQAPAVESLLETMREELPSLSNEALSNQLLTNVMFGTPALQLARALAR